MITKVIISFKRVRVGEKGDDTLIDEYRNDFLYSDVAPVTEDILYQGLMKASDACARRLLTDND